MLKTVKSSHLIARKVVPESFTSMAEALLKCVVLGKGTSLKSLFRGSLTYCVQ